MININDATAALAPKPEGFRLDYDWQQVAVDEMAEVSVKASDPTGVGLVVGADFRKGRRNYFSITALRELSAFTAALADYLERGQG